MVLSTSIIVLDIIDRVNEGGGGWWYCRKRTKRDRMNVST
jgi:hypothetical protein